MPSQLKEEQKQATLIGQKTLLLPFAEYDLGNFIRLHQGDKDNNMGRLCLKEYTDEQALFYITGLLNTAQVFIWTVYTKEDDPVFAGFIYITNVNQYMVSLHGIADKNFSRKKGLAEDAAKILIKYLFNKGVNRIETDVCESNKVALALDKKLGFVKEGVLRNHVIKDNGFENLVILSILKEEYDRGQEQHTPIQRTSTTNA